MDHTELLSDAFGRVRELVHGVVDGLSVDDLTYRIDAEANSIGWLVWHLTRIQDDHVANLAGREQVWTRAGWAGRFGLPFPASATGFRHGIDEVAAVAPKSGELLTDYYDDVHERTQQYVAGLTSADLDRVVDDRWDPPVTCGVRLVSVIGDDLQHVGQAAFVRGVLARR